MLLLCKVLARVPQWVTKSLTFVGTVSLELYLVHVNFVLKYLRPYDLGYWLTLLLMTAIALLLAWIIHQLLSYMPWEKSRK